MTDSEHATSPATDAAAIRFPPPFYYLIAIGIGVAIQRLALPLPVGWLPEPVRIAAGIAFVLLGAVSAISALVHFKRTGQGPEPWTPTPSIIVGGIYRFTRNPMYLGLALIQTGVAVGLGNIWILILLLPTVVLVTYRVIRREEVYLEGKFGEGYLTYKASVRRWI